MSREGEPGDVAARLRRLEDIEAIRRLLHDIARGTDRFDSELLARSIRADATLDMGGAKAIAGADFAQALKPPAAPRPGRMHIVANERIDVDGDDARSESYILSCQDVLVDGMRKTRFRAGRYLDRFVREAGAWKLTSRMLVDEWSRVDEVTEAIAPGRHVGMPVPHDPSCRRDA